MQRGSSHTVSGCSIKPRCRVKWPRHRLVILADMPTLILKQQPWGYTLYSDNRDDRRFLGVIIDDLVFLGVVEEKSFKKIKLVFVRV